MKYCCVPASGLESWQALLADPTKHWKPGYSAHALASAWERASGRFPLEGRDLLNSARDLKLLLALPEWKVYMRPSFAE